VIEAIAEMGSLRIFLETAYALAHAGQWELLSRYFDIVVAVLSAPEGVIIPGKPKDKPT
jgi:hypothetical protein